MKALRIKGKLHTSRLACGNANANTCTLSTATLTHFARREPKDAIYRVSTSFTLSFTPSTFLRRRRTQHELFEEKSLLVEPWINDIYPPDKGV